LAIWSLDDSIVIQDLEVSIRLHLGYNVEWSFNNEAPFRTHLTLLWFWFGFININNIPLLVESVVSVPSNDSPILCIKSTLDIKDLSFGIDDVTIFIVLEQLPPS
jgi:hypothetical protein